MSGANRAVFLDRDGTINEDVGYLDRIENVHVFPWSVDSVRLLNRAGFKVVVVSNQAGVARGLYTEAFVAEVHRYLDGLMAAGDAHVDAYYYCPHHPEGSVAAYRMTCECRKPQPGLIRAAERDLDLDVARSFVVGDRWRDIELGRAIGAPAIMVRTGFASLEEPGAPVGVKPDTVVDNLAAAVAWILGRQ